MTLNASTSAKHEVLTARRVALLASVAALARPRCSPVRSVIGLRL